MQGDNGFPHPSGHAALPVTRTNLTGRVLRSSRSSRKFTFLVIANYKKYTNGGIKTEQRVSWKGSELGKLKNFLKDSFRENRELRDDDRIDVYFFDESFKEWVQAEDVHELYSSSKGTSADGGHKISIEIRAKHWETADDRSDAGSSSSYARRIEKDFGRDVRPGGRSPGRTRSGSDSRRSDCDRDRDRDRRSNSGRDQESSTRARSR